MTRWPRRPQAWAGVADSAAIGNVRVKMNQGRRGDRLSMIGPTVRFGDFQQVIDYHRELATRQSYCRWPSPEKHPMRSRTHLSTLCLLVAVAALAIALVLLTARHEHQVAAMTAHFEAQLAEQSRRHDARQARPIAQAEEINFQLVDLKAKYKTQLAAKHAATASAKP
jgi:hypothetical protein